jgi:hypothetical protein
MTHPLETDLALFAGRDVSWWSRFRISRHLSGCTECGRLVEGFRRGRQSVRNLANDLPEGLKWDRLAVEMKANIRLGLAAGECVGPWRSKPVPVSIGWKPAAAFACAAMLITAGGWWLNVPPASTRRLGTAIRSVWNRDLRLLVPADPGVSVTADRDGVEVKQNGAAMTLMNPGTLPSVVTASTQGEVRARYVDADTGQVTITNAYAQ